MMFYHRTSAASFLLGCVCITTTRTLLSQQHQYHDLLSFVGVTAFTASPIANNSHRSSKRTIRKVSSVLSMVTISSGENFFDDFRRSGGDDGEDSLGRYHIRNTQQQRKVNGPKNNNGSKFVTGDELHRLRHQVLALRLELQEARRNLLQFSSFEDNEDDTTATTITKMYNKVEEEEVAMEYRHTRRYHQQRVRELEQAIMKTQQVDAEFVYTVSLERQELAERRGDLVEASRCHQTAMEARAALPQFNLEGLWVGKYSEDGYEMINVTYQGDVLLAEKVTGTKNVPKGQATFQVDLSPRGERGGSSSSASYQQQILSPIELGEAAAKQWGCRYLPRFAGKGQVAAEGYHDSQWIDGQLILVNEFFSFAWLPIGHQVFFGRPTPELILKLMKDEQKKDVGDFSARAFLEKCWEETEYMEDDLELNNDASMMDSSFDRSYYYEEGCFQ
ncbi:protein of unknown function DUF3506 containing protein [Nitzschia inconspicua]|uniref:Uncharacterized protein n=1 Tax=Nitzschia inconspicua TaxID=303405 RepID=A0A9K3KUX4_9STRA|nr:protein of unknown function DUF3506 containing protein [Nitzschia inconspicua]